MIVIDVHDPSPTLLCPSSFFQLPYIQHLNVGLADDIYPSFYYKCVPPRNSFPYGHHMFLPLGYRLTSYLLSRMSQYTTTDVWLLLQHYVGTNLFRPLERCHVDILQLVAVML